MLESLAISSPTPIAIWNAAIRIIAISVAISTSFPKIYGRLIFIHLQCWELLPLLTIQRQRCIKFRVLRAQDFYTPLALNCQKGQQLPAPEVYKNQSPDLDAILVVISMALCNFKPQQIWNRCNSDLRFRHLSFSPWDWRGLRGWRIFLACVRSVCARFLVLVTYTKGPPVLDFVRRANSARTEKFAMAVAKY